MRELQNASCPSYQSDHNQYQIGTPIQATDSNFAQRCCGQAAEGKDKLASTFFTKASGQDEQESTPIKTQQDKLPFYVILLMGMLTAFGPICTDIYLPAIPSITEFFGSSASEIQLSITATFLGLAIGQIIIGPLSDAYGRKVPLMICLLIFSFSSLACAYATTVPALLVARVLQGLAGAGGVVLSRTMACDLYQGARLTEFMAILMAINSVAPMIGPVVGSAIISFFAWPALFVFLTLWGVVLMLSCGVTIKETLPREKRQSRLAGAILDMFKQLANIKFLMMCLVCALSMGAFIGYLASSPFIFQKIYGLTSIEYAGVFAFNAATMSLGSQLAGKYAKRFSARFMLLWSLFLQIACSVVLFGIIAIDIQSFIPAMILFSVYTAAVGAMQVAGFGITMAARSGGAGSASGIFGVLNFLIGALLSPLTGLMGEYSMVPQALIMLATTVMSLMLLLAALRIHNQGEVREV